MVKRILIISSEVTGHGHKSIAESLYEKVLAHDDAEIHVVDGFSLGGKFLLSIGKTYGPITRRAESLWKWIWYVSARKPEIIDQFFEAQIKEKFLRILKEVKPDMILTVHPNFNGSILNILEKEQISIPFFTLIADLVNIYPLWADNRADCILCPTFEAKEQCIEFGIEAGKIKITGFPVRSRFLQNTYRPRQGWTSDQPFICLLMSGGEGSGNMQKIAENLLENFNCVVKIAAGRNKRLKAKLDKALKKRFGRRVEIYGFMNQIQELMLSADIIITRGSPNVMFEAIASNTPLIITGALPGQEEDNPTFAQCYHLAEVCTQPNELNQTISELFRHDGKNLKQMILAQKIFMNRHAADDILRFLLETGEPYPEAKEKLS